MPGFLYFMPGAQTEADARTILQQAGAGHLLERPGPDWLHEAAGPQGSGMLAITRGADGQLGEVGYAAEHQQWQVAPGGRYLVGVRKDALPGPADLLRAKPLPGYAVTMGDGRQWLIPVARRHTRAGNETAIVRALPSRRRLNTEGRWEPGEVLPRYADLWARVERHLDLLERAAAADERALDEAGDVQAETELMAAALAANHRIGAAEISLLGLITSEVIVPVLQALVDKPGLDVLKKKAQALSEESTSPGAEASYSTTPLA